MMASRDVTKPATPLLDLCLICRHGQDITLQARVHQTLARVPPSRQKGGRGKFCSGSSSAASLTQRLVSRVLDLALFCVPSSRRYSMALHFQHPDSFPALPDAMSMSMAPPKVGHTLPAGITALCSKSVSFQPVC
ncbi:hypothetical protein VFPBJ_04952 [Purpureocillium lilacinum]|uniref:Uncharacterized protein n=1 Tax=Purpureocillium lilacinum TaxID=33203 RepID=A0A179GY05_PURLI|nr:hypothetical protein VFPBJ_04952 [Purpureocillium lilacinum]